MKNLLTILSVILFLSCSKPQEYKIPVYGWLGGPGKATDQELKDQFTNLKNKGIDGLMYNGG